MPERGRPVTNRMRRGIQASAVRPCKGALTAAATKSTATLIASTATHQKVDGLPPAQQHKTSRSSGSRCVHAFRSNGAVTHTHTMDNSILSERSLREDSGRVPCIACTRCDSLACLSVVCVVACVRRLGYLSRRRRFFREAPRNTLTPGNAQSASHHMRHPTTSRRRK